jgi:hypothetical protein
MPSKPARTPTSTSTSDNFSIHPTETVNEQNPSPTKLITGDVETHGWDDLG